MAPAGGDSDEVMVLRHECPEVPVIVDADRVRGGTTAVERHGADVLVMDDGFQHRRLARTMNLVLVDATRPFGIPGLLPRGTWREPPASLARATHVMLTRCEQIPQELADIAAQLLAQYVGPRNILQQRLRVTGAYDADGKRWELCGRRVLAFAGIGNPDNFLSTLELAGARPSAGCWFGDHHHYDFKCDFARMEALTRQRGIEMWVTTLKDFVKLTQYHPPVPLVYLGIDSYITGAQAPVWREMLRAAARIDNCENHPFSTPCIGSEP
jgi:tetraacyldisaccharide 4'-kinase